jgi:hypothetical protein
MYVSREWIIILSKVGDAVAEMLDKKLEDRLKKD